MKRIGFVLLMGALVGYVAGWLNSGARALAQPSALEAAQGEPLSEPPWIPPVPNPPVHPDPPDKPRHWSASWLREKWEERLAIARANPDEETRGFKWFEDIQYRTYKISGGTFRSYFPTARPSEYTPGAMTHHMGADQHDTVTDFLYFVGGRGYVHVEGYLESPSYGKKRGGPGGKIIVLPGERNSATITGGRKIPVQAGDWLSIPPLVEHQYLPEPNESLAYTHLKIRLGAFDHPGIVY